MRITGKMKIDVLHGNDLAVPAAGRTTFNPKGRALGRLADDRDHLFAQVRAQGLAQSHRGGGFARRTLFAMTDLLKSEAVSDQPADSSCARDGHARLRS